MSREEIDRLFTYHAPSQDQVALYDVIRGAERACIAEFGRADGAIRATPAERFAWVNDCTRAFFAAIDAHVPDGADKSAALRCVRLARMAKNEHIAAGNERAATLALDELTRARWQACAAIALAR